MFGLGTGELLLILIVVVLLFGAKKIPELMRGLGSGLKEFKKASSIEDDEKHTTDKTDNNKPT
jgi:sec-independent protein translocase protein TatA